MKKFFVPAFAVLCAVLLWICFGAAAHFGFAPIDDSYLIAGNLAVLGPNVEALKLAWTTYDPELYIPLTIMSYHLDFLMHHLNPEWMHIEDFALHFLSALLAFFVLRKWTKNLWGSALGALLFLIHPVQVEAAVWLSARKDLLMTFFALLSLLSFERFLEKGRARWMVPTVLLLACALLSKPSAVLLPVVMTLRMSMVRGGEWRRYASLIAPWVVTVVIVCVGLFGKSHLLGLRTPFMTLGIAMQGVIWTLGKLVFLVPLRVSYDLLHPSAVTMVICAVATLLIVIAAWRLWRRQPMMSLGIVWFLALLAPALFNTREGGIATLAADRYAYLPLLGISLFLIGAGEAWLRSKTSQKIGACIAVIFLIICAVMTRAQTEVWSSPVTLFTTSLQRQPDAVSTRIALVNIQDQQNETQQAFDTLKQGLSYGDDARLHLSAGLIYAETGDVPSAKEQFGMAQAMDETSPDGYFDMGSLLRQTGDIAGARTQLEKAISLDPSFVEARLELARVLIAQNDLKGALEQTLTALQWNPSSGEADVLTARIYQMQHYFLEARPYLADARIVADIDADMMIALATQALHEHRPDEAQADINRLALIDPNNPAIAELRKQLPK